MWNYPEEKVVLKGVRAAEKKGMIRGGFRSVLWDSNGRRKKGKEVNNGVLICPYSCLLISMDCVMGGRCCLSHTHSAAAVRQHPRPDMPGPIS